MSEFMLPWDKPEIKQVIDLFGCIVMGIEEAKPIGSEQMDSSDK